VRWKTDPAARCAAIVLLTAACSATPSSSATPSPIPPSTVPSAGPSTGGAIEPGQPYDAAAILDAMRTSPRPDGVPDELQTDSVAASIADAIWTIDGEPWDAVLIDASCGESSCLIDVAGTREGAAGDDVWTFGQTATGGVELLVEGVQLHAIPESVVADLDRQARSLLGADVEGMVLTAATWQPPPNADEFALSYRSGGEEGSCGMDLVLDAARGEITDQVSVGSC
jgi:hypothetical protein